MLLHVPRGLFRKLLAPVMFTNQHLSMLLPSEAPYWRDMFVVLYVAFWGWKTESSGSAVSTKKNIWLELVFPLESFIDSVMLFCWFSAARNVVLEQPKSVSVEPVVFVNVHASMAMLSLAE